jgi:pimeloyl-ACP methyl ester carboxylesterase
MLNSIPVSRRRVMSIGAGLMAGAALSPATFAHAELKKATLVLVHGAWHGGWCWRRVSDRLTEKGHYVVAPTLSGLCERSHLASDAIDLSTHIDDVAGEIKWKDLNGIVLVGHSYGGMVITGVAEKLRDRISAIVYLDAFQPDDGQSLYDTLHTPTPTVKMVQPHPAAYFHVNERDQPWVNSKLTPQPVRTFSEEVKVTGAYQSVPEKVYIRAPLFQNPAFDRALQRCRADRTWKTEVVTCGHDVMIDQPEVLTAILEKLV